MKKKVLAVLILSALLLAPAGLARAAGPDDPVSSEVEPGAGETPGEVDAIPEPVLDEEPAPDKEAPDYVHPDEEGEAGITSTAGENAAEDADLVWALDDEATTRKSHTWIYICAGAALLLFVGLFYYSRKKAKAG